MESNDNYFYKIITRDKPGYIMFIDLPESVQQQVLFFLEADNFKAAKELRDQHLFHNTTTFVDSDKSA